MLISSILLVSPSPQCLDKYAGYPFPTYFLSKLNSTFLFKIWWLLSVLKLKVKVAQSCPTLCDPKDCTVHGILQVRILEWVALPFTGGSSQPREPRSPALRADSLPVEPLGKAKNTGVGSLSLLQQIFRTGNQTRVSCIAGGFFTS